jgi:integrase/recombinase XerD
MPTNFSPGQRPPRYLTQDDIRRFFSVIKSPRDRALFALIYQHGLRVGEVALLARGDVNLTRGRIVIRRLKGGRWSEQPLFAGTQSLLCEYIASAPVREAIAPLFPGRSGPLQKRQIQSLFERYREAAQLPEYAACHSLRHSIATHLLDAGQSLQFIQEHLGHQSIRSTTIYARITDRHRAEVFRQLESSPWIVQPADCSASTAPDSSASAV